MEVVGSNLQFTPTISAPDIEERERNVFQSTLIISCIYQPKTTVTDIVSVGKRTSPWRCQFISKINRKGIEDLKRGTNWEFLKEGIYSPWNKILLLSPRPKPYSSQKWDANSLQTTPLPSLEFHYRISSYISTLSYVDGSHGPMGSEPPRAESSSLTICQLISLQE